jgi:uncharacterized protein YegL
MSKLKDVKGITRRVMTLFFVVDTSGSMEDKGKISAVNEAIRNVLPEIQAISKKNADAEIKVAVLEFSTGARWVTPTPVKVVDFIWEDLETSGLTDLGRACDALNAKLSREEFMHSASGSFAPVILLLSDGEPTDNYEASLAKLKDNNWFKYGLKFSIAMGDDANIDVLAEFAGGKEAVVTVYDPVALMKLIEFVIVTSAQIGSQSQPVDIFGRPEDDEPSKQDEFVGEVGEFIATEWTPGDDSGGGW